LRLRKIKMIRKIVGRMKNNPVFVFLIMFLAFLIVSIIIQAIINTVLFMLFMRVVQLQEALKELVLKLFPLYPTYCF